MKTLICDPVKKKLYLERSAKLKEAKDLREQMGDDAYYKLRKEKYNEASRKRF